MRSVGSSILALLVALCLAFYGPFGMARASDGSVISMVICADGVAQTVLIDADGNPVDPVQTCPDCLTCCHATGVLPPQIGGVAASFARLIGDIATPPAPDPFLTTRNLLPAPRGPPALTHRPMTGHETRSDGRPSSKDATA